MHFIRIVLTTLILLVSINHLLAQPPYSGTIFIAPALVAEVDSTTFVSATYTGQGNRVVFDRRTNSFNTINGYLFEVAWNDGLQTEAIVNPEFGSIDAAKLEAEFYGEAVGRIPACLRRDVDELWIHKGVELFGGGNRSILIHTGQSQEYINNGILEETLIHEAAHTSLDADHANAPAWLEAQQLDGEFISTYARDNPLREDIAESFLLWLAVRHLSHRLSPTNFDIITQTIPNRLSYFDGIMCNLSPVEEVVISNTTVTPSSLLDIKFFPNPVKNVLYLQTKEQHDLVVNIYNLQGKLINTIPLTSQSIDLSNLIRGIYMVEIKSENKSITKKVLKW